MERNSEVYNTYIEILKRELVLAFGCTEPIMIAYCGAKGREVLGAIPTHVEVYASGNIIKNVKSVIVPNTGNEKGIASACLIGILQGDASKELEVIKNVSEEDILSYKHNKDKIKVKVYPYDSEHILDLKIVLWNDTDKVSVHIQDEHTNIIEIIKNDSTIFKKEKTICLEEDKINYDVLKVNTIYDFATTVCLEDVKDLLQRQISCNMKISEVGLLHSYGANIGEVLLQSAFTTKDKAKAFAASASDARMSGCELPVVINSGSGNQGITTSIPVIVYAKEYDKTEEELLRALVMSNLVTLHLKSGIGRLSAYCGAISAGVGAGAGIAYLLTRDLDTINHTIVNALAIASGVVCDGAKASCAAKIATAVEAGILGFEMYQNNNQFYAGDGLVSKGVENTINNFSILGHDGMKETDKKIIELMTK